MVPGSAGAVHGGSGWGGDRVSTRRVGVSRGRSAVLVDPERPNLESAVADSRGHVPGLRCSEPGCADCRWDAQRLKYWLRGRLLAAGVEDAQVDAELGPHAPDVLWRKGSRVC